MFISNEKLVNNYFCEDHKDKNLLNCFEIIQSLAKKYGKRFFDSKANLELVKKHSSETYEILELLIKLNKLQFKDIFEITKLLKKKYSLNQKEFYIKSDSKILPQINQLIESSFKSADINSDKNDKIGIDIKGEGYHYKRDLDRDLNLLLGSN